MNLDTDIKARRRATYRGLHTHTHTRSKQDAVTAGWAASEPRRSADGQVCLIHDLVQRNPHLLWELTWITGLGEAHLLHPPLRPAGSAVPVRTFSAAPESSEKALCLVPTKLYLHKHSCTENSSCLFNQSPLPILMEPETTHPAD